MSQIKEHIRNFFNKHISYKNIDDDSDIFQLGYVNSLFAMQIVNFVEKQFVISIDNDDLNINNFRTINKISQFIERKKMPESSPISSG